MREIASRTDGFREVFIDASGGREETRWQPLEPASATGNLLGPDDLVLVTAATMRIADHYTVRDGKLQTDQILWGTGGNGRAQLQPRTGLD